MNHHLTSPMGGSGEDRLTAEIFMMLQRDDPGTELHRDVVNAVMQDRQAPPDFEEQQQFHHHQRMHQLQLIQQQQLFQNRHSQASSHQQRHQYQPRSRSDSSLSSQQQSNLWYHQQQNTNQYQPGPARYPDDYTEESIVYDQGGTQQQRPKKRKQSDTNKKSKKPRKKKASKQLLPTAATANNPSLAAAATAAGRGGGVVADAEAVITAAAAAAAVGDPTTVMEATLPPPPGPPGKYSVGTFVTKHFPAFGWFKGRIIFYDHKSDQYKIQYEDTDLEDLTETELTKVFDRAERAKPGFLQEEARWRRRARYEVGTKVKKLFYAFGWCEGTVEEYDDETDYYRVAYEDGDKEDLDEEEVFEVLMDPRNHKKPRTWLQQKLSKKEREEYSLATFDPFQAFWLPLAPPPPPPKYSVGTELYKFFQDHGWYKGSITQFDTTARLYKVQYEDKDKEDLEEGEVTKLIELSQKGPLGKYYVGKAIAKYFAGHGWFTGKIISYDPISRLYKVQYEDKDKEDLDAAEVTKALDSAKKQVKTEASPKKSTKKVGKARPKT